MGNGPFTVPQPSQVPGSRFHGGMGMYGRPGGFGHGFEHHGGDHHWIALVLFILLVVALILLAVSLARLAFRRSAAATTAGAGSADDALGTLRMRYARGEIGRDEFLLAHADLGGPSPPTETPA